MRTVVAWDDSVESRTAVAWAIERARHTAAGHEVVLVRVIDEVSFIPGKTITPEDFHAASTAVAAEAARIARELPAARMSSQVVIGDTLNALRRYTDPASLLVVGTEARTYAHFRFAWSIGARLAATALGPVAIIPRHVTGTRSGVVVGVDGSETSTRAALFAAGEAALRGVELHIIHVWLVPPVWQADYVYDDLTLDMLGEEHESIVHDAAELVRRARPELVVKAEAVRGTTVRALLDASPLPQLVVVGCRSRSAVNRFVLGSASHELILNLDVPVVIVSDRVREAATAVGWQRTYEPIGG
ncbi:universal stress protein [Herbiconiux sp. VKM Ac-1786]|uniref:universal stress protein n=1 Tax=Herbiconiux sp. VKM Ac-1786 TaxID=2783824 RepID=UPI00188CC894|nr:universal stress protein [Herbiconiux sp. VKM Ac-1786]